MRIHIHQQSPPHFPSLSKTGGLSNFFVDGEDGKPWTNTGTGAPYLFAKAKDTWYPTWAGKDSALQVGREKLGVDGWTDAAVTGEGVGR